MSSFEEIVKTMTERCLTIKSFGKKLRFELDDQVMFVDGTANPPTVSAEDAAGDATITVSVENFSKLLSKKLNPMMAFTTGKVRMKGDMSAAAALQKIF